LFIIINNKFFTTCIISNNAVDFYKIFRHAQGGHMAISKGKLVSDGGEEFSCLTVLK